MDIGGYGGVSLKTHGMVYDSSPISLTTAWADYGTHTWSPVNPFTGLLWTWNEINALQIGPRLRCAQADVVYLKVIYTPVIARPRSQAHIIAIA